MSKLTLSVFAIFLATINAQSATSRVKISKNGYSEIVVAFHNSVNETYGLPLIQKIKDLFTSGSNALYQATRQRAYFNQVTILVPKTWSKKPEYQIASYEVFTEADVMIQDANPLFGNGPYTSQPTPCGQPARYIHYTPEYLKNLDTSSTRIFGDPGKTLAHEWAHFRYGIFDEYPEEGDEEFPAFYIDQRTEEVLPNACTNADLSGEEWNPKLGRSCTRQRNGLPEDDCVFIPDVNKNDKITSSIASHHYLPNVFTFCDDTEEFKHNEFAPNMHNKMCQSRSTWSVITSHKDFNNNNLPVTKDNVTPSFKIVQQEEATFCLVLDISGSMTSPTAYPKITMLHEAASRWLKEEVKIGSNVGIVEFGQNARIIHPIVPINNEANRKSLIDKVPSTAPGSATCIGCGLRSAIQELARFRKNAPGGIILLLSDGEETNDIPKIITVLPEIVKAKIRVITMAFTKDASPNMEKLAEATGGKQFSIPTEQSVSKLQSSFQEIGTYQTTNDDLAAKIEELRFQNSKANFEGTFTIDATIGRDTVVRFLYSNRADITDIIINTKDGWEVSLKSAGTIVDESPNLKQIKFTFKDLPVAKYSYKIIRGGLQTQDITVSVLSKSRTQGQEAIRTTCTIEEIINSNPPQYLITAEVRKGLKPVISATVISKVDLPNGQSVKIELFDKGKKGDIMRDDGIYSGYFTQYVGIGRYSVSATVVSNTMTAVLETEFLSSRALPIYNKRLKYKSVKNESTGDFQRVAEAGSIQIKTALNSQNLDLFPPGRVTDLTVVEVADDNSYVILEWSAPGDDLQNGRAERYELKYTMNRHELQKQYFGVLYNVTSKPKEAGEMERLRANFIGLGHGIAYYVALRAQDDSGKWSEVSNIVEVRGNIDYE